MKLLRLLLSLSLLLALPSFAHAQVTLTLDTPHQAGQPGDLLTFTGTLTNTGTELVFFSGDSFSLNGTDLVLDDSPFFLDGPLALNAGEFFNGTFFTVQIAPTAPYQFATGTFTVVGGPNEGDLNDLVTANFSVNIAAPEPSSGLLALGVVLGAVFLCRRIMHGHLITGIAHRTRAVLS